MRRRWLKLLRVLLLAFGCANAQALTAQPEPATAPDARCGAPPATWMQRALDTWALVSRDALGLPADSLPWIILFDARCAWHLAPRSSLEQGAQDATLDVTLRFGSAPVELRGLVHGDSLRLPSGRTVPAQPTAFASLYRGDSASFFVMALPELWSRSPEEAADPGREEFFLGVLAHEMAHTVQLAAISRHVSTLSRRWALPQNLNDDVVQRHFDTVPAFSRSVEHERDLLVRAAVAADDAARRELTRQALAVAERRRARHFVGELAVYAPLEDVFLLMEGVGSWAAFRVALAHAPPGTRKEDVLARMKPGQYWSQELGLAMLLVLDALLPDWRARVFAQNPPSIYGLLSEAARFR